jgi:hypothetical protein
MKLSSVFKKEKSSATARVLVVIEDIIKFQATVKVRIS